ncbi:MAG: glycoside hydrolase family 95 protein, partial [Spirochaetales bacterium]|nr:glycoside hydrolase family 95 protein [Spirochaetales bacterium]
VYGGIGVERIELNEDTIWSGRPSDEDGYTIKENIEQVRRLLRKKQYSAADELTDTMTGEHDSQSYQMAGNLYLNFDESEEALGYKRTLDISTAVSTSSYEKDGVKFHRESFISAPHQVMAIRITADQPGSISFSLSMDSQMHYETGTGKSSFTLYGNCPYSNKSRGLDVAGSLVWEKDGTGGMKYVVKTRILNSGGEVSSDGSTLKVEGADEVVLLLTIETGFLRFDQEPSDATGVMEKVCDSQLEEAAGLGWGALKDAHCRDYAELYERMSFSLDADDNRDTDDILKNCKDPAMDPALVNLVFNYGRYLLISSSRSGTQPANLQGIWNDKLNAPWRCNYTININTEMNYWPAETCNLADCAEPMLRFVREIADSGRRTAKKLYGARGWCSHHNSDLWRYTYTGGRRAQHAFWPVCGAWLCQHLWEHYAFSGDRGFLAEALPIMKDAAAFLLDFMIENEKGELITSPSTSPENRFFDPGTGEPASVCEASAMDMTMIRELFENIIEGSTVLDDRDELLAEIQTAYTKLAMPKIGSDGRLLEFDIEAEEPEPSHRHVSHMYGVYPGWMFTPDSNQEYFEACRKSLDARGDKSTGWAMGWRVALWARLGDGNRALKVLGSLLCYINADASMNYSNGGGLYANLWDAHPPFQIDGNFGVTAGIAEMLLQSHQVLNGKRVITLLPALPDSWDGGSAAGIRARGGVEAAFSWKNGKVVSLTLEAKRDIELTLKYNGRAKDITLSAGERQIIEP